MAKGRPLFFYPQMEVKAVTGAQKTNVQVMRRQGLAPSQIAEALGLSVNTVKSFCRRNNLSATSEETGNEENKGRCKQCGKRIKQDPQYKPKKFCSDGCRYQWWNMHRNTATRTSLVAKACPCCGVAFKSYASEDRKYCSHDCYIASRYRKGALS